MTSSHHLEDSLQLPVFTFERELHPGRGQRGGGGGGGRRRRTRHSAGRGSMSGGQSQKEQGAAGDHRGHHHHHHGHHSGTRFLFKSARRCWHSTLGQTVNWSPLIESEYRLIVPEFLYSFGPAVLTWKCSPGRSPNQQASPFTSKKGWKCHTRAKSRSKNRKGEARFRDGQQQIVYFYCTHTHTGTQIRMRSHTHTHTFSFTQQSFSTTGPLLIHEVKMDKKCWKEADNYPHFVLFSSYLWTLKTILSKEEQNCTELIECHHSFRNQIANISRFSSFLPI